MSISRTFIERPVMTTLVMAAMIIFGLFGYSSLPVSDLPNFDFPTITVTASLPGADPETMASAVAAPLENAFSTINGIDSMTSNSVQGRTQISIQFNLDRNIDSAAQDVQSAISSATRRLPRDMPSPPTFRKQNPADAPILFIALSSTTLEPSKLDEYAETLLARQISTVEGVAQVQVAKDDLGEWPSDKEDRQLSNIVFMGMGEPLYNLGQVADAIEIISDNEGIGISRRRITVSTSGVVPQLQKLGETTQAMLAISLHATNDALRDVLVPLNKKYPIAELMAGIRAYPGLSNARRVTFEYVMLKGVNDSPEEARALVKLIKGIPAKINLIPFNPWPGSDYQCSDWATIEAFAAILNKAGYSSPIRTPRGRDILAACGQLKSESEKVRASALRKLSLAAMAGVLSEDEDEAA